MVARNWGLMQFFKYKHLPENLQEISKPFADLALHLNEILPDNSEKSTMLRRLLEAKDCAVRAKIFYPTDVNQPVPPEILEAQKKIEDAKKGQ